MGFRRAVVALLAGAVVLGASGCFGGDDDSGGGDKAAAKYDGKPATITLWTGFSDRELNVIKGVMEDFHKQNPKITVNVLGERRRRQDHRRRARGQLARRGALVLDRQHRRVLLVGRLDQAAALHGPGRPDRRRVPGVGAELHEVRGQPVHAADARRRVRALLQQGPARQGGHQGSAEDLLGARGRREEAHAAELRRNDRGGRLRARPGASTRTRPPITRRSSTPTGPTTRASRASRATRAGPRCSSGARRSWTGTATTTS